MLILDFFFWIIYPFMIKKKFVKETKFIYFFWKDNFEFTHVDIYIKDTKVSSSTNYRLHECKRFGILTHP